MLVLDELLTILKYKQSPYYRNRNSNLDYETAHLFQAAFEAGVSGIYVFQTSSENQGRLLAPRPVVFVAEESTEEGARQLHRKLWNSSNAPFLIVKLPSQIRIYTGFNYSESSEDEGLLESMPSGDIKLIQRVLSDFSANAIDSGRIWESNYAVNLNFEQRVDSRLLKNLRQLGNALKQDGLENEVAHALIGKYVYISYLRDRGILTDIWLEQQGVEPERVFSLRADIETLSGIDSILENRFNGKIFPIAFDKAQKSRLQNRHVSWVASVFGGSEIIESAPDSVQQLHLPFKAYDFQYIPVETFSAIYEQFIDGRKAKGAIYTPEFLADYIISEIESVKPLKPDGKFLDPACGSGVFLVLAYRRIIQKEMLRLGRRLKPQELKDLLLSSIYGVERERDACYVTEFSLILTLLHYVEPRELQNLDFKFPDLHNKHIFESDFFDLDCKNADKSIWQQSLQFDWIVGNPPWSSKLDSKTDEFALNWIKSAKSERPVSGQRIAEAFSWLVTDLLSDTGVAGLLLPATSLVSLNSTEYRRKFFKAHIVYRITNFANLRSVLFGKGKEGVLPAFSIIYSKSSTDEKKQKIIHYGPFAINQRTRVNGSPWMLAINENEIQQIDPYEAEKGETILWKIALWGNRIDKDVIERLQYIFPVTLNEICKVNGFHFHQGSEIRHESELAIEKLIHVPNLEGNKRFLTDRIDKSLLRMSIDQQVLASIPNSMCYIRAQGGRKGLRVNRAPHMIISPSWMRYIIFSESDFFIPPRQIGIAASNQSYSNAAEVLRALTVYLSSRLVAYYLFFQVPEWGFFRQARRVSKREVGKIPTPAFTPVQIEELADLHRTLVEYEISEIDRIVYEGTGHRQGLLRLEEPSERTSRQNPRRTPQDLNALESQISRLRASIQQKIDETIFRMFNIPKDIQFIINDFLETRLTLDSTTTTSKAIRPPYRQELIEYAIELRDELDSFSMETAYFQIELVESPTLIECTIKPTDSMTPVGMDSVRQGTLQNDRLMTSISKNLREKVSQWVYVQRGLRLFEHDCIFIYKTPRRIDWTRTQAIMDAGDIIGEIVAKTWIHYENNDAKRTVLRSL